MAYDLYRQFIQNYAVNVLALRHADFEDIFTAHKGPDLISKYKSFIRTKVAVSRKIPAGFEPIAMRAS